MRRSSRTLVRAIWATVLTSTVLLGCNAILGIDDPIIVDTDPDAMGDTSTPDVRDERAEDEPTPTPTTCAHGSPFDPPKLVPGLEDLPILGARLNETETNIYLSLVVDGGMDLYIAGRTSRDEKFGAATRLSISTATDDYWPTVDRDEHVMFFESGVDASDPASGSRIWFTSRDTTGEQFRKATLSLFFSDLPAGATDSAPYLVPSGNTLYFTSIFRPDPAHSEPRAPTQDIWAIVTNASGTMLANRRLTEISTDQSAEQFPVVSADQREILFSREGAGDFNDDIWMAQRDGGSFDELFGSAMRVDQDAGRVNSGSTREWASWLSPDNCRLYFVRTGQAIVLSESRLWFAERRRL